MRVAIRRRVPGGSNYFYTVYGVSLSSDIPLALEPQTQGGDVAIQIRTEPASFFARAIRGASFDEGLPDWYQYAGLEDLRATCAGRGWVSFLFRRTVVTCSAASFAALSLNLSKYIC